MSYLLLYILFNYHSNWILDVKGIKTGIYIGAIFTALGAGLRSLVSISFYFVIGGQIFCGIAQPIIMNALTKVAIRWFGPSSVTLA